MLHLNAGRAWTKARLIGNGLDEPYNVCTQYFALRDGGKKCNLTRIEQQQIADLYSDYLLASFDATTAIGLSQLSVSSPTESG